MVEKPKCPERRIFLKSMAGCALGAAASGIAPFRDAAAAFKGKHLQVWSCGGLAEAMMPAHRLYEERTAVTINYTGAFAGALGKSLLGGAQTEVFAGRVLDLAKKLRQAGKMVYFKPLCFTSYVLVTPKGNPGKISQIGDLIRPGVRLVLAPGASPPGGAAALNILNKAGILDQAMKNAVEKGTCVQRVMDTLLAGKGDVSIVELRITRMADFVGKLEVIPIPEALFPPPPLTFTVGVMKYAKDRDLADDYLSFLTSPQGQEFFERQGFIPALSAKGQELIEKLGVKDV
jgi:molybdate transport system substrate-binding protein